MAQKVQSLYQEVQSLYQKVQQLQLYTRIGCWVLGISMPIVITGIASAIWLLAGMVHIDKQLMNAVSAMQIRQIGIEEKLDEIKDLSDSNHQRIETLEQLTREHLFEFE